uniref:UDP-glycosyltransferases domain-containing protein n=1 Tax=Oryza brachyantha TaxID=4533 RepID=J3MJP2_ORYBR
MAEQERALLAGRRVALFPLPFQGHLSPMLQLAAVLRARGLAVALLALNAACEAPFRDALASLLPDVACAVVDGQWYAALGAAPRGEQRLDEPVPELEPLRVRDLIRVDGCQPDALCGFIARVADAMCASASGVVVNTFAAIEASELDKIQAELSQPAFAVGPLHKLTPAAAAAEHDFLYSPDRSCVAWLDAHPPRSVLYVSLGSVACIDRGVFEEMAWGLSISGVPFLWVVRPGSVRGGTPPLPHGLDRSRGKIVPWAPQRDVLAPGRPAGSGRTAGGTRRWRASAKPCFADQTVNARYVTHQWGVGLELGEVFDRARAAEADEEFIEVLSDLSS